MMAGAGGAVRATGWRATAIRFQQFGEGGGLVSLAPRTVVASGALKDQRKISASTIFLIHLRARGADDGGRRRRGASYGVARDSHPVSTIR